MLLPGNLGERLGTEPVGERAGRVLVEAGGGEEAHGAVEIGIAGKLTRSAPRPCAKSPRRPSLLRVKGETPTERKTSNTRGAGTSMVRSDIDRAHP